MTTGLNESANVGLLTLELKNIGVHEGIRGAILESSWARACIGHICSLYKRMVMGSMKQFLEKSLTKSIKGYVDELQAEFLKKILKKRLAHP